MNFFTCFFSVFFVQNFQKCTFLGDFFGVFLVFRLFFLWVFRLPTLVCLSVTPLKKLEGRGVLNLECLNHHLAVFLSLHILWFRKPPDPKKPETCFRTVYEKDREGRRKQKKIIREEVSFSGHQEQGKTLDPFPPKVRIELISVFLQPGTWNEGLRSSKMIITYDKMISYFPRCWTCLPVRLRPLSEPLIPASRKLVDAWKFKLIDVNQKKRNRNLE